MASKYKPVCESVFPWLRANLGKNALAGLTGGDYRALRAAAQIVELWSYGDNEEDCIRAFGLVVRQMQTRMRFTAYYSVAHVANWSDCLLFWSRAGLPAIKELPRCKYDLRGEAWWSLKNFEIAAAMAEADGAREAERPSKIAAEKRAEAARLLAEADRLDNPPAPVDPGANPA